jgi:hypothetical protein
MLAEHTDIATRIVAPEEIPDRYHVHADEHFDRGHTSGGGFITALYQLCSIADLPNLAKLLRAFPTEVSAWIHRFDAPPEED